jgi:endonuclease/exonuclease/phosphatase family metal-dependent hydrolase
MMSAASTHLKLMTYNIGGGRDDDNLAQQSEFDQSLANITQVIQKESPDILVLQEVIEWIDENRVQHNTAVEIARALGYIEGLYYGSTLSLQQNFHSNKTIFVRSIFNDWWDFRQGNAILSRSNFVRLGNPSVAGQPRNLPVFRPIQYEGSRDTDPRYALLSRIVKDGVSPFIIGTHLSTLRGERGDGFDPGKASLAAEMRSAQVRRLLALIREQLLQRNELVFLLGDFNAAVSESCIENILVGEGGFTRLVPRNDTTPTHLFKVDKPIDHIFVYPASRLVEQPQCRIVDTDLAFEASDHLPVVADVTVI